MKIKCEILQEGQTLEVGDLIECRSYSALAWRKPVTRVTPKWAFVRHNDVHESKYRRVVESGGPREVPRGSIWGNIQYRALRKVK